MNDNLYNSLFNLSLKAIEKILSFKEQGNLITIPYRHLPVAEINYQMETFHYDWENIRFFDFYDWKSKDFVEFMHNQLNKLPECDIAANEIGKSFEIESDIAKKYGLSRFFHLLMKDVPNKKITEDNISDYINLFISDYESLKGKKPINWTIHLWLQNIVIESDEIEIAKGVFLRHPTKEQLADVSIRSYHTSEFDQMTGRGLSFGAILSFSIQAKRPGINTYPEKIIKEIENWLNVLRLFKPSSLIATYQMIIPTSLFEYEISQSNEQPFDKFWKGKIEHQDTSSFKLYLKQEEEKLLQSFIPSIKPIINGVSHKTYLSGNWIDLALHRYNDSLVKSEVNAYRILSAITSLESLLSDGNTELTFKIGIRCSKLVSFFGFNATETFKKMKLAYSLRSKLVHGSKLKTEENDKKIDLLEWARNHTHEIINFNRICLLIALQLKNHKQKSDLVKILDNSLIDNVTNIELAKIIDENVRIQIADPYPKRDNIMSETIESKN